MAVATTWMEIAKEWVDIAKSWVEIAMPKKKGLVQPGSGPTLWAQESWVRSHFSIQPRAAAADLADLAHSQSKSLDQGNSPVGPVAPEA